MGYLDVPSSHAHFKCSQQTYHFHQLGMGLFLEEYGSAIDLASGEKELNFFVIFIKILISRAYV